MKFSGEKTRLNLSSVHLSSASVQALYKMEYTLKGCVFDCVLTLVKYTLGFIWKWFVGVLC